MAEWLCSGLQSRVPRFDSGSRLQYSSAWSPGSSPDGEIGRHKGLKIPRRKAYRFDSGSGHQVFATPKPVDRASLANLLEWGRKAMIEGLLALESVETGRIGEFAKRGLALLANGVPTAVIDDALRRELDAYERNQTAAAKIWLQAGGYSPTFGILGAVLGLIQTTSHISEPVELGKGIAIAFVATLYGVGFANLVYLPLYGKIKAQIENELRYRKLYLDGILAIARKESPKTIETRLLGDIRQRANDVLR
jgi:chemotaxis protein MotA